ncbi:MAG: type IV toxin-antitoxin system AbiEi family antitoxin [Candidatus Aminicenantes bacterium]|nr:type IV toxin-antitoxin system AbiEi family antitoxin [Candidatus Aminicenantes bacterium]
MLKNSVKDFVENIQAEGRYSFEKSELNNQLNLSPEATQSALKRLARKNRIATPRKGFYVIIPLEYRSGGIIPASWFINQLMTFLDMNYYVGLLSAAALHGAAHQQPQEFHVVTAKQIRPIEIKGIRIKFFTKSTIKPEKRINHIKTETGYINVSNPEITALDLIRYCPKVGGFNFISTVLLELSEKIKASELLQAAKMEKNQVYIQRLGYILDYLGKEKLTTKLNQWFRKQKSLRISLAPGILAEDSNLNQKWNIWVNKIIEVDEL